MGENKMSRSLRGVLLVAVMLALTAGTAFAQSNGSIFGKVTAASGAFQFPIVAIGTVTVTFELTGFKKAVHPNIIITTNFNAQVDQKMEIGGVTQEITVTAAALTVDPKKVNTGGT